MNDLIALLIILLIVSIVFNVFLALGYREALKFSDKMIARASDLIKHWNDALDANGRVIALNEELLKLLERRVDTTVSEARDKFSAQKEKRLKDSARRWEIQQFSSEGMSIADIAKKMGLPESTVRNYRSN